jgi:polyhydroxybutyrate depolymerase
MGCNDEGDTLALDDGTTVEQQCVQRDIERCWFTYSPALAVAKESAPIVIDMHGIGACPTGMAQWSGWQAKATKNGFHVVWPKGQVMFGDEVGVSSWNAGHCCMNAMSDNVDDLGFLAAMVEALLEGIPNADPTRIYWAGHSNGCMMSQRMAYERSDLVAAVACHSGYLVSTNADSSMVPRPGGYIPTPVLVIIGEEDHNVPWDPTDGWDPGGLRNLGYWEQLNDCPGDYAATTTSQYQIFNSTGCAFGTETAVLRLDGAGHWPYSGKGDGVTLDTTQIAWDFLQRFTNTGTPIGGGLSAGALLGSFALGIGVVTAMALVAYSFYARSQESRRATYDKV